MKAFLIALIVLCAVLTLALIYPWIMHFLTTGSLAR